LTRHLIASGDTPMGKKARSASAVKKSSSSVSKSTPSQKLREELAHRSACLHAARASLAEIRICEQELAALDDIARLTSALNYRIERRREFLEEQADIERTRLRERVQELRCADLRAVAEGARALAQCENADEQAIRPWAIGADVSELAAMAAESECGGAR
jgi:hypothetical protein